MQLFVKLKTKTKHASVSTEIFYHIKFFIRPSLLLQQSTLQNSPVKIDGQWHRAICFGKQPKNVANRI